MKETKLETKNDTHNAANLKEKKGKGKIGILTKYWVHLATEDAAVITQFQGMLL